MLKRTPFFDIHIENNAKIVPFAGYEMPIQYKGVIFEHNTVRNQLGIFDVSHMTQIIIKGENAKKLVQKITTNNVLKLSKLDVQYSCMLNKNACIIDDLLVYKFDEDEFMLVTNASNSEKNLKWINENNHEFKCLVEDITSHRGLLAIQGPESLGFLQKFTDFDLKKIQYYKFKKVKFMNFDVIISNTGYTGAGGFELYFDKEVAIEILNNLLNDKTKPELAGLAARDTLRLEMGYCLYGNDIDETTTPLEASLSWIVKLENDFIGIDKLKNQKIIGLKRKLVGFTLIDKGIPRKGYEIFDSNNQKIGIVTSGTMSPSLNKSIGMGYVNIKESNVDNYIFIKIRNKLVKGMIVKRPFYVK